MKYKIFKIKTSPISFVEEVPYEYDVDQSNGKGLLIKPSSVAIDINNNKPEPEYKNISNTSAYIITSDNEITSEALVKRDEESYYYILGENNLKYKSVEFISIWSQTLKNGLLKYIQTHINNIV